MDCNMRFSICIPTYKRGKEFLQRALDSVHSQNFKDYEIVIEEDLDGKGMAFNTNRVIKKAKGELIKILYQDDYLEPDYLQKVSDTFIGNWLFTASSNNPNPRYSQVNTLGSPSALTIRNENPLLFNESLKWVLDLDYYRRMYQRYGLPQILTTTKVIIGLGVHQETNHLSQEIKQHEHTFITTNH
jgi:glycosyltransferase involved in cell wall biosynthesis